MILRGWRLRDPNVACTFQTTIGGKFAPLIGLSDEDMDMDTNYNTAVTDAASEILGQERRRKKPWVTKDVLDLCDERRDLKKKRYEAEGAKEYKEANRRIQKAVKKAKEDWIGAQCEEIETCLNKNNSKRGYQLVKDLTSEKQGRSSTIQDKSGKCLTEEKEILSRCTEYYSDLYNYESCGDNAVLDCSQPPEEDLQPILREEVEIAVASLKNGKSRKENPQKLTQLSSRSYPRHLVGKRTAQKDITIDTTSDSQVNSNFPNRWSPASLTFNNYFYLFLYLYIT